jgi:hypothetical protein
MGKNLKIVLEYNKRGIENQRNMRDVCTVQMPRSPEDFSNSREKPG